MGACKAEESVSDYFAELANGLMSDESRNRAENVKTAFQRGEKKIANAKPLLQQYTA